MNTFNTYIDGYFRPFSEEDLGFLRERGDRSTPYIMPTLGTHYTEIWAAEDGLSPAAPRSTNPNAPRGTSDALTDDLLETSDVSCGPLLSRILAAMIPEDSPLSPASPADESAPGPPSATSGWKVPVGKSDYAGLEERLQKEMQYIGLLGSSAEMDWRRREDDDVSAKLRELQGQLRVMSVVNGARKSRIGDILKEQLAHQEYATILDDLDKQVRSAVCCACSPALLLYPCGHSFPWLTWIQNTLGRTSILQTHAQHESYKKEEIGTQRCRCCASPRRHR